MNSIPCPVCGTQSAPVSRQTVKAILVPTALARLAECEYFFCSERDCTIVYFSQDGLSTFTKSDVKMRIGVKETEDPVALCYCFGYTQNSVRDEYEATGNSTVVDIIAQHIEAHRCACDINNPSGKCCLGHVSKYVQGLMK